MSTTGWTPARSTTEQRRSASWKFASADLPWMDWPRRGAVSFSRHSSASGESKDLTYIATLCSAGLIRLGIFEQRPDATDIHTAKPETRLPMQARAHAAQKRWTRPSVTGSSTPARRPPQHRPSFRAAFAKRRGLIPADGFHEWRREGGVCQPWLIARRDGGLMAFAALRERWRVPEGAVRRCIIGCR